MIPDQDRLQILHCIRKKSVIISGAYKERRHWPSKLHETYRKQEEPLRLLVICRANLCEQGKRRISKGQRFFSAVKSGSCGESLSPTS